MYIAVNDNESMAKGREKRAQVLVGLVSVASFLRLARRFDPIPKHATGFRTGNVSPSIASCESKATISH